MKINWNWTISIEFQKPKPLIVAIGGITTLCVFFLRNPCNSNPCSSNLQICKKISGWEHKCDYRDQCDVINCGQGECINNGTCACYDGYVENVELKICEETCLLSPCQELNTISFKLSIRWIRIIKSLMLFVSNIKNNGTCFDLNGSQRFSCICPINYIGETCQTNQCEDIGIECLNGGTCVMSSNQTNQAACHCTDSFLGKNCEFECCGGGIDCIPCYEGTCKGDICECNQGQYWKAMKGLI